jgi:fatty-acyl-CoA synthase
VSSSWPAFPRYNDPLRQWRHLAGDRLALVDRARDQRLTYAEFDQAADNWAALLELKGIGREDRVAVIAGNRSEVAALFFACTRVGAALVPLNWRLAPQELRAILHHANPALIIGESRFRAAIDGGEEANIPWLDLESDAPHVLRSVHRSHADVELEAEDAALIL